MFFDSSSATLYDVIWSSKGDVKPTLPENIERKYV